MVSVIDQALFDENQIESKIWKSRPEIQTENFLKII